jgi:hypothetical protein
MMDDLEKLMRSHAQALARRERAKEAFDAAIKERDQTLFLVRHTEGLVNEEVARRQASILEAIRGNI